MIPARSFRSVPALLVASGLALAAPAGAQVTYTWTNPAGGNWSLFSNWSSGNVPNTALEAAGFNLPGTYSVNVDLTATVYGLALLSPNTTLSILPGNTLTLATGTSINSGVIEIGNGVTALPARLGMNTGTAIGGQIILGSPVGTELSSMGGNGWSFGAGQIAGTGRLDGPFTNFGTISATSVNDPLVITGTPTILTGPITIDNNGNIEAAAAFHFGELEFRSSTPGGLIINNSPTAEIRTASGDVIFGPNVTSIGGIYRGGPSNNDDFILRGASILDPLMPNGAAGQGNWVSAAGTSNFFRANTLIWSFRIDVQADSTLQLGGSTLTTNFSVFQIYRNGPIGVPAVVTIAPSTSNPSFTYAGSNSEMYFLAPVGNLSLAKLVNPNTNPAVWSGFNFLTGNGTLEGNWTITGGVAPGSPFTPAGTDNTGRIVTRAGAVQMVNSTNTRYNVDIRGEAPGSFDVFGQIGPGAGNSIHLAGALNVTFILGYSVGGWERFDIVEANTLTGKFNTTNLPAGTPFGPMHVVYLPQRARLVACYANCDGSDVVPVANALDFSCFLSKYSAGDPYANCDGSTIVPIFNALDFSCFLTKFSAGCPVPCTTCP